MSQSLSGWDGVFHRYVIDLSFSVDEDESQSLSGWDGVFHGPGAESLSPRSAIRRNPFQGGMGFFT